MIGGCQVPSGVEKCGAVEESEPLRNRNKELKKKMFEIRKTIKISF